MILSIQVCCLKLSQNICYMLLFWQLDGVKQFLVGNEHFLFGVKCIGVDHDLDTDLAVA